MPPRIGVQPTPQKYLGRIAKSHAGQPVCITPGCGRPAVMRSPQSWGLLQRQAWCSTTCHERWKQLQPKEPKK